MAIKVQSNNHSGSSHENFFRYFFLAFARSFLQAHWPDFVGADRLEVFPLGGVAGVGAVVLVEQFRVHGGHAHEDGRLSLLLVRAQSHAEQMRPHGAGVEFRHQDAPKRHCSPSRFHHFLETEYGTSSRSFLSPRSLWSHQQSSKSGGSSIKAVWSRISRLDSIKIR